MFVGGVPIQYWRAARVEFAEYICPFLLCLSFESLFEDAFHLVDIHLIVLVVLRIETETNEQLLIELRLQRANGHVELIRCFVRVVHVRAAVEKILSTLIAKPDHRHIT